MNWPHDDPQSLIAFYGRPWLDMTLLVHVTPPFAMNYEGAPVHGILIHQRCSLALTSALAMAWEKAGRQQSVIDQWGLSNYSGTFNYRNVRGATRLSCHAFGAAIDIDAEHNPMGSNVYRMPSEVVECFEAAGATWGGTFQSRKDAMHFQWATERG